MADNLLLLALPAEERRRLSALMELVELEFQDVLIEANEPITQVYFPIDCISSTLQEMQDGTSIEVGLMGVEGFIGVQFWLRSRDTPSRTLIQVSGRAYRMSAEAFRREVMQTASPLNDLIARYIHGFLTMTAQVAACNRLHTVEERLCRWLKMIDNRIRREEYLLRQEFIAQMLGVHRPSVSIAANILQKAGLISYSRGRMRILDRDGLGEGACECYETIEAQFDRIFGQSWRELVRRQQEGSS